MDAPHDTILAIASPPGRSLRGIIRLSGPECLELMRNLTTPPDAASDDRREEDGGMAEPMRGVHFTRIHLGSSSLSIIALTFPAPRSYTGQDSIELQLPGNPDLLQRVIATILERARELNIAVRRAEPGEFTARAFLNNRMSLTQAEGVAATIAARSDSELRAATMLRSGALGDFAHVLANDLANALALVEAGIDFTDQEDVVAISPGDLHRRLRELHARIDSQLARSIGMEQLQAIPWVVLVGEPNAGKSALFNALLGRERAVVSSISGTTRDVLTEPLTILDHNNVGGEVMLVDLAGLDEHDDSPINRLMQQAARDAIQRAELIVRCVPIGEALAHTNPDELIVRTKCDLASGACGFARPDRCNCVSANTGAGLAKLRAAIAERLSDRAISLAADTAALRPRHEAALRSALDNLHEAIELVEPQRTQRAVIHPELIASSMRAALDDLSALAGDITPDEVLGRIFATFCVGK